MSTSPASDMDSGPIGPLEPRPFGDYLLLRRLGVGGMGEVYLSKHGSLGGIEKYCVVKTLRPNYTQDREYVSRFIDEARVVVQLNHRNICHVFDVGQVERQFYLAMEYVTGKDLRAIQKHMVAQGQTLPEDLTVYVMREILEALDYAHRHRDPRTGEQLNIVHRDVSPQNIMINYEGETKLIDFGLAVSRLKVERTEPQIVMGKLFYMSPEQARGGVVDQRTDIFAIGITLYEMLVGARYYEGKSYDEVWGIAGGFDYKPPHWHKLSPDMQRILSRALEVDADRRYQDCSEFLDDLITYQLDRRFRTGAREVRSLMHKTFEGSMRKEQDFLASAARVQPSDPKFKGIRERTQSIRIAIDPKVVTPSAISNAAVDSTPMGEPTLGEFGMSSEERTLIANLGPDQNTATDMPVASEAEPAAAMANGANPTNAGGPAPKALAKAQTATRTDDVALADADTLPPGDTPPAPPESTEAITRVPPPTPLTRAAPGDTLELDAPKRTGWGSYSDLDAVQLPPKPSSGLSFKTMAVVAVLSALIAVVLAGIGFRIWSSRSDVAAAPRPVQLSPVDARPSATGTTATPTPERPPKDGEPLAQPPPNPEAPKAAENTTQPKGAEKPGATAEVPKQGSADATEPEPTADTPPKVKKEPRRARSRRTAKVRPKPRKAPPGTPRIPSPPACKSEKDWAKAFRYLDEHGCLASSDCKKDQAKARNPLFRSTMSDNEKLGVTNQLVKCLRTCQRTAKH